MKLVEACICARKDRESSFHHCGVSVKLMQACLKQACASFTEPQEWCIQLSRSFRSYFLLEEHLTVYLNSTKTDTGRLEEFSPRRLTVLDIRLDLVAWSVEDHRGFG